MRTSNVVLKKMSNFDYDQQESASMTGVGIKSGILLLVCIVAACFSIIFLKAFSSLMFFIYALGIIGTVVF